jgi:hypothetical protein
MKLNNDQTGLVTVTGKTNVLNYNYKLCDECVIRTDSIRYPVVLLDSRLFFYLHHHVDYVITRKFADSTYVDLLFSTIDYLLLFYFIVDLN